VSVWLAFTAGIVVGIVLTICYAMA